MKNRHLPFWILTVAALIGLTLPVLIQDGMFADAVLYSCVSRNLSEGWGTFWFPQYSTLNVGGLHSFHEHPPLVFGIQSLFFKLLGDSIYTERIYTYVTFLLAIMLIIKIWNIEFRDNKAMLKYSWLPLVLWISSPVIFWSYSNNMQENTLNVFCLAAVFYCIKAYKKDRIQAYYFFLTGIFVFLATFSKGIPGFFPIAIPLVHWMVYRKETFLKAVRNSFIIVIVPITIYIILLQFPTSKESLSLYFFKRLLHRVDADPTARYRLESVVRIMTELIPSFIIIAIVLIIALWKKTKKTLNRNRKTIQFYLLIGATAGFPLILTMVQKGFYLAPCFPYLSIGLSLIILPYIDTWINLININTRKFKVFTFATLFVLTAVLIFSFMQTGKISREENLVKDIYQIGTIVPKNATVTVPAGMYYDNDFVMPGFLMRYDHISISPYKQYKYLLIFKEYTPPDPEHFRKIPLRTTRLDLYEYSPKLSISLHPVDSGLQLSDPVGIKDGN